MTHDVRPLPARIGPLMLAHTALTGDVEQRKRWLDRLETIDHANALDAENDPELRALLADRQAWREVKAAGGFGASYAMGLGSLWMSVLIPLYAVAHGFGWLAGAAFLLPIPIAWKVGRRLWERAVAKGMLELGRRPSKHKRFRTALRAIGRSFGAGFGFGFTLVFLQALITWFMTPAATIALELSIDLMHATVGGAVAGTLSAVLAPIACRQAPSARLGAGSALVPYEP